MHSVNNYTSQGATMTNPRKKCSLMDLISSVRPLDYHALDVFHKLGEGK